MQVDSLFPSKSLFPTENSSTPRTYLGADIGGVLEEGEGRKDPALHGQNSTYIAQDPKPHEEGSDLDLCNS